MYHRRIFPISFLIGTGFGREVASAVGIKNFPIFMKYLAIFATLTLMGCPQKDEVDSTITICNNAPFSITHKMRDIAQLTNPYGDSIVFDRQTVLSNTCKEEPSSYLDYFANVSDTIPIYFFNTDTLKAYPWSVVRDSNMYLERRILTRAYLDSVGWRVDFQ
jgi:hypothetical protein